MDIIAHRGCSGNFPENTLAAFRAAARLPIDGVEFDVQMTKDGELVVIHDETIDRTSNGTGYVKDMTLEQLRTYGFGVWFKSCFLGERIPTLQEVLDCFPNSKIQFNIELKNDFIRYEGMEKKVIALIRERNIVDRVVISSFNHDSLRLVRKLAPEIATAMLTMGEVDDGVYDYAIEEGFQAIHLRKSIAMKASVKHILKRGAVVRVFTVNNEQQAEKLRKLKVAAIFTDYPEKMLKLNTQSWWKKLLQR